MPISFNGIPADIRVPLAYIEFDNSGAVMGTPAMEWRLLLLGRPETDATGPTLEPIRITGKDQAAALWGKGSQIASMVRTARSQGVMVDTWCLAVPPNADDTIATGSITLGGTPTQSLTLPLYIGGVKVGTTIRAGDTAEAMHARQAAAINANPDCPVTARVEDAKIKLTAKFAGAEANQIDIRTCVYDDERLPLGLTITITPMTDGAGDVDMDLILSVMGDQWWKAIATPFTSRAALEPLQDWLDDRFGPLRQQETLLFAGYRGTLSATSTYGNGFNHQCMTVMGTNISPSSPWNWSAAYATQAVASLSLDPARPLQTLPLRGVLPPRLTDRWTAEERNLLLHDGIATAMVQADGTVAIEREITTYQTNSWGEPDPSYLDVQTVATLGYWRYGWKARITQKFPRHKLADDGTKFGSGQAIVTPSVIRAELIAFAAEQEQAGLVENLETFKAGLIVERNKNDRNRVDILAMPDLVNQFRIMAMQTRFVL